MQPGDAIEDGARDHGLAERRPLRPAAPPEEVVGADREEVVGREQTARAGHDAMPVGVGVVAEREIEALANGEEVRHGVGRRAVRADLAVVVERNEAERGVDRGANDLEVQPVFLRDAAPVAHARAAHGIGAQADTRARDRVAVDRRGEVGDVRSGEVVGSDPPLTERPFVGDAGELRDPRPEQFVRAGLDGDRHVGVCRPPVRRVVLEPAVFGRVVRGGHDDPVGAVSRAPAIGRDDRVRDHGRRRVPVAVGDAYVDPASGEALACDARRRFGHGVRVATDVERPVGSVRRAVVADGVRDRDDVVFVEGPLERATAVPARTERDALRGKRGIGVLAVKRGEERRHVDERRLGRGFSGERRARHRAECNLSLVSGSMRAGDVNPRHVETRSARRWSPPVAPAGSSAPRPGARALREGGERRPSSARSRRVLAS